MKLSQKEDGIQKILFLKLKKSKSGLIHKQNQTNGRMLLNYLKLILNVLCVNKQVLEILIDYNVVIF